MIKFDGNNMRLLEGKMNKLEIKPFDSEDQIFIQHFFKSTFLENKRTPDFDGKDLDLTDIKHNYCSNGNFWCLKKNHKIVGTIGIRRVDDFYEIRRFFILKKYQNRNYGKKLLLTAMHFAFQNNFLIIKLATMKNCINMHHLIKSFGFYQIKKYNNSTADYFWQYDLTEENFFKTILNIAQNSVINSLVLNPTENFPDYYQFNTEVFEGLYVSERHKNKNDIVIFGGRDESINLYNFSKELWKKHLNASDVDLKTFSGLNAHLILFLCIAKRGDKILLLPENAGGHFSTEEMLKKIGLNVLHFAINNNERCIDKEKSLAIIKESKPNFIFIDRSEGLIYENFDWLNDITDCVKVFDASQYLTQIITGYYPNPLLKGFNYLISTLHKNYPGPQKCIIATNKTNKQWKDFLKDSKTFISNTHPENIFKSVIPLLNISKLHNYSSICIECCSLLNQELILRKLPVVLRNKNELSTLHIWLLPKTKNDAYNLFLKLEQVNILVNYRKLPYDLGYGLRIGVNAAVKQGLRPYHIPHLAEIISEVYFSKKISDTLINRTKNLIKDIIAK